uniref:Putative secreted protein n=1 Tax=Xenopsylla cheopis TaxID=163159 RepID=A0A6M2DVT3_XENCH
MKCALVILICCLASSAVFAQKEGLAYGSEAIREAQSRQLIPPGAQVDGVIEGIEVVARENIPGSERIELAQLLSGQFPPEAIAELQARIDQIAFRK